MKRFEVPGEHYSATLVVSPEEKEDGWTYATGFIKPPFFNGEELIDATRAGNTRVYEYVTTSTTTVLTFSVEGSSERVAGDSHDIRVGLAIRSLRELVERLNHIENGNYDYGAE